MADWPEKMTGTNKFWIRLIALVVAEVFLFTSIDLPFDTPKAYAAPNERLVPPFITKDATKTQRSAITKARRILEPSVAENIPSNIGEIFEVVDSNVNHISPDELNSRTNKEIPALLIKIGNIWCLILGIENVLSVENIPQALLLDTIQPNQLIDFISGLIPKSPESDLSNLPQRQFVLDIIQGETAKPNVKLTPVPGTIPSDIDLNKIELFAKEVDVVGLSPDEISPPIRAPTSEGVALSANKVTVLQANILIILPTQSAHVAPTDTPAPISSQAMPPAAPAQIMPQDKATKLGEAAQAGAMPIDIVLEQPTQLIQPTDIQLTAGQLTANGTTTITAQGAQYAQSTYIQLTAAQPTATSTLLPIQEFTQPAQITLLTPVTQSTLVVTTNGSQLTAYDTPVEMIHLRGGITQTVSDSGPIQIGGVTITQVNNIQEPPIIVSIEQDAGSTTISTASEIPVYITTSATSSLMPAPVSHFVGGISWTVYGERADTVSIAAQPIPPAATVSQGQTVKVEETSETMHTALQKSITEIPTTRTGITSVEPASVSATTPSEVHLAEVRYIGRPKQPERVVRTEIRQPIEAKISYHPVRGLLLSKKYIADEQGQSLPAFMFIIAALAGILIMAWPYIIQPLLSLIPMPLLVGGGVIVVILGLLFLSGLSSYPNARYAQETDLGSTIIKIALIVIGAGLLMAFLSDFNLIKQIEFKNPLHDILTVFGFGMMFGVDKIRDRISDLFTMTHQKSLVILRALRQYLLRKNIIYLLLLGFAVLGELFFMGYRGINWSNLFENTHIYSGISILIFVFITIGIMLYQSTDALILALSGLIKPHILPEEDFSKGIPDEHKTVVIIPFLGLYPEDLDFFEKYTAPSIKNNIDANGNIVWVILSGSPQESIVQLELENIRRLRERLPQVDIYYFHRDPAMRNLGAKPGAYYDLLRWLRDIHYENPKAKGVPIFDIKDGNLDILLKGSTKSNAKNAIILDVDSYLLEGFVRRMAGKIAADVDRNYTIYQSNLRVFTSSTAVARLNASGGKRFYLGVWNLFGLGYYSGHGAGLDIDTYLERLADKVPAYSLKEDTPFGKLYAIAHDILEGTLVGKVAYLADLISFEEAPSSTQSEMRKFEKWVRGSLRIGEFLWPYIPTGLIENPDEITIWDRLFNKSGQLVRNRIPFFNQWLIFVAINSIVAPLIFAGFFTALLVGNYLNIFNPELFYLLLVLVVPTIIFAQIIMPTYENLARSFINFLFILVTSPYWLIYMIKVCIKVIFTGTKSMSWIPTRSLETSDAGIIPRVSEVKDSTPTTSNGGVMPWLKAIFVSRGVSETTYNLKIAPWLENIISYLGGALFAVAVYIATGDINLTFISGNIITWLLFMLGHFVSEEGKLRAPPREIFIPALMIGGINFSLTFILPLFISTSLLLPALIITSILVHFIVNLMRLELTVTVSEVAPLGVSLTGIRHIIGEKGQGWIGFLIVLAVFVALFMVIGPVHLVNPIKNMAEKATIFITLTGAAVFLLGHVWLGLYIFALSIYRLSILAYLWIHNNILAVYPFTNDKGHASPTRIDHGIPPFIMPTRLDLVIGVILLVILGGWLSIALNLGSFNWLGEAISNTLRLSASLGTGTLKMAGFGGDSMLLNLFSAVVLLTFGTGKFNFKGIKDRFLNAWHTLRTNTSKHLARTRERVSVVISSLIRREKEDWIQTGIVGLWALFLILSFQITFHIESFYGPLSFYGHFLPLLITIITTGALMFSSIRLLRSSLAQTTYIKERPVSGISSLRKVMLHPAFLLLIVAMFSIIISSFRGPIRDYIDFITKIYLPSADVTPTMGYTFKENFYVLFYNIKATLGVPAQVAYEQVKEFIFWYSNEFFSTFQIVLGITALVKYVSPKKLYKFFVSKWPYFITTLLTIFAFYFTEGLGVGSGNMSVAWDIPDLFQYLLASVILLLPIRHILIQGTIDETEEDFSPIAEITRWVGIIGLVLTMDVGQAIIASKGFSIPWDYFIGVALIQVAIIFLSEIQSVQNLIGKMLNLKETAFLRSNIYHSIKDYIVIAIFVFSPTFLMFRYFIASGGYEQFGIASSILLPIGFTLTSLLLYRIRNEKKWLAITMIHWLFGIWFIPGLEYMVGGERYLYHYFGLTTLLTFGMLIIISSINSLISRHQVQ
jgi:hypothetical protein